MECSTTITKTMRRGFARRFRLSVPRHAGAGSLGYPSCFNQGLVLELAALDPAPFVSANIGSTDNRASSSHLRVAGHSGGRLGGRCKNWTPIGVGEGDQRPPCTRIHPQATLSGCRPRAARSAARDHRLLPAQSAHHRRNPGLEPGLYTSPEGRRLRRERSTRLLLQPLLRGTCRPHSAGAGRSHPRTLRSGARPPFRRAGSRRSSWCWASLESPSPLRRWRLPIEGWRWNSTRPTPQRCGKG